MKDKVFQKDFYCVYNDYNVSLRTTELNLLYLPLVGSDAVKLYQFLGSKMIGDTNLSKNYLHYDIFDNLALDVNKFIIARKKLEAIGLLQSFYINNSSGKQYVYKIKEALSFFEFFNTPILCQLLENTIGNSEYNEIKTYYSFDKVSFNNFEELTVKFSDIYNLENLDSYESGFTKTGLASGPNFDEYFFDFSKLNYYLANSYLSEVIEKSNIKNDILGLAHLYKVTPSDMAKAIEKVADVNAGESTLNVEKLKNYLTQLYVNVRKQEVPTLDKMLNRKLVEEEKEQLTEEDKFIREVDNIDYITYLNKQKGLVLSNVDARNITEIQEKYNFPTGVLNILLEYSINTSNSSGLPHKNYIDKIASSWQSQRLLGAKDAIEFVRKSRNMRTVRKNVEKTASVWNSNTNRKVYKAPFPEYLKQQMENISTIKSSQNRVVTQEDEDAYNEMMKELTRKKDT